MKTTNLDLNLNKQNKLVLKNLFLLLVFFSVNVSAQQGINYKAIIKDGEGYAIANGDVTIQFTILENGTENVYQETHDATTDANGIVIVNIGEGTVVSGVFEDIDWSSNPHSIKTEINTGGGLVDMGTTDFKAVPYAFHSLSSSSSPTNLNDLDDAKTGNRGMYLGYGAGASDNTYNYNTGIGYEALYNNHQSSNTAIGYRALYSNTSGINNTAIGVSSLQNSNGQSNTAVGYRSMQDNTTGRYNVAIGENALLHNEDGYYNVAIGMGALSELTSGQNNIAIGNFAQVPNSTGYNQVQIGNSIISYAGIQVAWTITSDKRWKENVHTLPYGLDLLMQLKPVEYNRINNENKTKELGFIAQDLEELLEDMGYNDLGMLTKDDEGYLHLRYNDFIAILTKAIQEQQEIINRLNEKLEMQVNNMSSLNAELFEIKTLVETLNLPENNNLAEK